MSKQPGSGAITEKNAMYFWKGLAVALVFLGAVAAFSTMLSALNTTVYGHGMSIEALEIKQEDHCSITAQNFIKLEKRQLQIDHNSALLKRDLEHLVKEQKEFKEETKASLSEIKILIRKNGNKVQ